MLLVNDLIYGVRSSIGMRMSELRHCCWVEIALWTASCRNEGGFGIVKYRLGFRYKIGAILYIL